MTDVRKLCRIWLDNTGNESTKQNSGLLGFDESLGSRRTNRDENVRSIGNTRIPIIFHGKSNNRISIKVVSWSSSCIWGLKDAVDDYDTAHQTRTFTDVESRNNIATGPGSNAGPA